VPPFWFWHGIKFRQMIEFTKAPPDLAKNFCAVRFEDVHNRTEAVMLALSADLGIRWDPCLLASTFDGEPYWAIRGGVLLKPGDTEPVSAFVTGVRPFDEHKIKLKFLGLADRLRLRAFCDEPYRNWGYVDFFNHGSLNHILRKFRAPLLLWPSHLDRRCFIEDLRLELAKVPGASWLQKFAIMTKSLANFVRQKISFRNEMLALVRAQAEWPAIRAVYVPNVKG
jgi:hypothetical protein